MDALMIIKQIDLLKNKNLEKLTENKENKDNKDSKYETNENLINIGTILSIIIGAYAAFLSYSCNTKKNVPETHKIIFAVLAYCFGLLYLIYFFLFKYDDCVVM